MRWRQPQCGVGGCFGAALFGSYSLWGLQRLLRPGARVIITHEGLVDDNFWYSPGLIRWEDIVDVRSTRLGLIAVDLRDEQAFWERLTPLQQLAAMKAQLYGFGPALIVPWGLGRSGREVVDLIQAELDNFTVLELGGGRAALSPDARAP